MVVSAAFEELTEVLKCLESSNTEIKNVALHEETVDTEDKIMADLTVAIPVLSGVTLHDDVSIQAESFEVQDRKIDVNLTVTLPLGDDAPEDSVSRNGSACSSGGTDSRSQPNAVPAYKDPEALQAVYEEYDTFPEMTEALGADVTSETVRRYMVDYDIHDPSDNTPQAHSFSHTSAGTDQSEGDDRSYTSPTERTGSASRGTADSTDSSGTVAANSGESPSDTDESAASDRTGNTNRGSEANPNSGDDELGNRSVAELLAEMDNQNSGDKLIADGLGIPQDLTIAELASIVNQSNTIHEVGQRLSMSQGNARRLLQGLDLISFVTHRLAADQIDVSHAEIKRRISSDSH
jgi:hypothetical protein